MADGNLSSPKEAGACPSESVRGRWPGPIGWWDYSNRPPGRVSAEILTPFLIGMSGDEKVRRAFSGVSGAGVAVNYHPHEVVLNKDEPRACAMMPEPRPLAPMRGSESSPEPLRVLVVDDDRDAADTTANLLTICGADARACYCGATALETLSTFPAEVCILDLSMPDMQGWEVAMLIRLEVTDPPYLAALTAYSDETHRNLVRETGFDLHLVKPVDPATLLHELGELAKRPRGKGVPVGTSPNR